MKHIKNLRNNELAETWGNLHPAHMYDECICYENHEGTLKVYSDGTVYSYNLLIGEIKKSEWLLYDFTAPGKRFYSKTTSRHVGLLKRWASRII